MNDFCSLVHDITHHLQNFQVNFPSDSVSHSRELLHYLGITHERIEKVVEKLITARPFVGVHASSTAVVRMWLHLSGAPNKTNHTYAHPCAKARVTKIQLTDALIPKYTDQPRPHADKISVMSILQKLPSSTACGIQRTVGSTQCSKPCTPSSPSPEHSCPPWQKAVEARPSSPGRTPDQSTERPAPFAPALPPPPEVAPPSSTDPSLVAEKRSH